MKERFGKIIVIAIAFMIITASCSTKTAQPTPNLLPTATTMPDFPTGTFIKGGWTWEINSDGSYYTNSSMADENGFYTVTGDQVAIQGDFIPCKDIIGTYTWTYDTSVLILTAVDDQCTDRREATEGKWRINP